MRTRDIHDPACLTEIAYNHAYAVARKEQARILRALFKDLFQRRRPQRAHKACRA